MAICEKCGEFAYTYYHKCDPYKMARKTYKCDICKVRRKAKLFSLSADKIVCDMCLYDFSGEKSRKRLFPKGKWW